MQEPLDLGPTRVNRDLLGFVRGTPLWFWLAALFLLGGAGTLILVVLFMSYEGLWVTGLNRPVYWAVFITNFVYWIGISHAGVMMSSVLRLTKAEWRRPVTRIAEVLTVFSLITALLFPIIHTGRPWRTLYWAFPYDFARDIWPNVRSPLIWDPAAIVTYLIASSLSVYLSLVPDLATARARATGWQRPVFGILSLGFRGTTRQWRMHVASTVLLSAMILAVFLTVHSIVAWDFGVQLVPGWHSTALAPYFILGAMHSGIASLVIAMVLLRFFLRLERYITADHFDSIGRLQIIVGAGWMYFFLGDFISAMASQDMREVATWQLRLFEWPYNLLVGTIVVTGFLIPMPLWIWRRTRRNPAVMFWIGVFVNVGLWIERYTIIVPSLVYKQPLTFTWAAYAPSWVEIVITLTSFAFAAFGFLIFCKFFPIIPIADEKEGEVRKAVIEVGKAEVPAIIRE